MQQQGGYRRKSGSFESERGVTSVSLSRPLTYVRIALPESTPGLAGLLQILHLLAGGEISINLVKLHPSAISFVVEEADGERTAAALREGGFTPCIEPSVRLLFVYAAGMRGTHGVMARISGALLEAGVALLQTGDAPDTVFCLVEAAAAEAAASAVAREFEIPAPAPPIVVQKFGGRSVGTAEARRLAAERVREAVESGARPVVVVSAIGRMGEPYATDTLLAHLREIDESTPPEGREQDLLMACGEIISTVIMSQTLRAAGLKAVALTGAQAGIITDHCHGDAQILEIEPAAILRELEQGADAVVVAGFQGATREGAVTTLGRGGSDTTASALAAALSADRVEIYTHVDGVMTADPELVPGARTLDVVSYDEVAYMAHQGAKVLHPRAAEIAMKHQIPLWVKTSFERRPGTMVAPLKDTGPAAARSVTGVAAIHGLTYYTLTGLPPAQRAALEHQVYSDLGRRGIAMYLNSVGPQTSSFLVAAQAEATVDALLLERGHTYQAERDCAMVSLVALNMWEQPGFLLSIAEALNKAGIELLQMADSDKSVSCLVRRSDAASAALALHEQFELDR